MTTLRSDHPALREARTIFMKSVKPPAAVKRVLQPASANTKMGAGKTHITRGRWRGMPMYLLTLQERKTCPKTCQEWANCYGNNMYLANRIDHEDGSFYATLTSELSKLALKHPSGFVVRLHVLGDFFSVKYVNWWRAKLKEIPQLRIYGYTHRMPEHRDGIGKAIQKLNAAGAFVRYSDRGGPMSANVDGEGLQCPQEVGKTESCLTCGLCWQSDQPIKFTEH